MSFPRYEKYKDSGVEWVGEVPQDWATWKLSQAFGLIGSGTTPKSDNAEYYEGGDIAWLNTGDLNDGELFECAKRVTDEALQENTSLKLYPAGSVVLAMYGATIGKLAMLRFAATVNQACCVFALHNQIIPDFIFYWFMGMREHIVSLAIGSGQPNISQDILGRLRVICPSTSEQQAIVSFLHREVSNIDRLIAEQQHLIDLLKEKRQTVISHAVTKGLDPNVTTKDSGSDWLGFIPNHWNSGVLVRCASRIVVGIAEAATHAYADEGVPILRSTNIRAGRIIGDILRILPEFAADRGSKLINSNDLITVRTGNAGVTAVVPPELDGCQCFTMLITSLLDEAVPEFYCYYINSDIAIAYFGVEGWGTAQVNISVPILKALPIPIPSKGEQQAIVRYLDIEVGRIDELTQEAEKVVSLLVERRSALISAAVTGKIDVRKYIPKEAA